MMRLVVVEILHQGAKIITILLAPGIHIDQVDSQVCLDDTSAESSHREQQLPGIAAGSSTGCSEPLTSYWQHYSSFILATLATCLAQRITGLQAY
jgi:hypothetical protein